MKISVSHNLTIEQVKEKLKNLEERLKQDYKEYIEESKVNFTDDKITFFSKVKGYKVDGVINILENKLDADLNLPLALKPFSGMIKNIIEQELKKLLNEA